MQRHSLSAWTLMLGVSAWLTALPASATQSNQCAGVHNLGAPEVPPTATLSSAQLIDVTTQLGVTKSAFVPVPDPLRAVGSITIRNTGSNPVVGSVAIVLNDLASGVVLLNASGQYGGAPYVYETMSLNPCDSLTIPLQFANTSRKPISFAASAYQLGPNAFLTTATPYHPQQQAVTYEPTPLGFKPVFTEAIVRHGSRGTSSFDATVYNMYLQAQSENALTPLGAQLGPDVMTMFKANALLDVGVAGITAPGYGNLSQTGIQEERQLATRLLQRLPDYFAQLPAANRQILIANSGVNRAIDSEGFFTGSLASGNPSLAPLIVKAASLSAYPMSKPASQAAGVNRFLLYFHKLNSKTDLDTDPTDPYYQTYMDSLAYQAYLAGPNDMTSKVGDILSGPDSSAPGNARSILEGLFTPAFVDSIENGTYKFYNSGSYTFTSDDGSYTTTVTGDGSLTVGDLTDAALELYSFYSSAPAMRAELKGLDFSKYIPAAQASVLAYLDDVQSFYQKGPGIAEDGAATYQMAQVLLDDMFKEVNAVANGDLSHGAKLRFTHAEEIMPMASILGLKNVFAQAPTAENYSYDANPWRGAVVAPYAANFQWDIYKNSRGTLLVRMLYNEKETDFKAACDTAKYLPASHYYDYNKLKACYDEE